MAMVPRLAAYDDVTAYADTFANVLIKINPPFINIEINIIVYYIIV